MKIKKIVVLGGGTAGWLTANHLGKALSHLPDVEITVLESPDIPTIGVGEGTVPMIRQTLQHFGIDEADFIRRCDVTFKQSIKFINWMDSTKHGKMNNYHHLFDYPYPFPQDLTPYWLAGDQRSHFADTVSIQRYLCELNKAPKQLKHPPYEGDATYAYHLNAKKFAGLLSEHAQQKFAVRYKSATVQDVTFAADGALQSLITSEHGALNFDFFVDCSGFSSFLLGDKMQVPFIDKSNQLMINAAIAVQVPTSADAEIPSYTLATAHQAGWIWDIALTTRRGVGLVYAEQFMSQEQAMAKLDRYLGGRLHELQPRKVPMKIGYRQEFWRKNCVAIGLSQGFVEPLEATAILLTDYSAKLLANNFPTDTSALPVLARQFNQRIEASWQGVMDFIKLHYYLSDRTDSAFWCAMREPASLSDNLADLLDKWRFQVPTTTDFFSKFSVFDAENYLYVLYGMKYPTHPPQLPAAYYAQAEQLVSRVQQVAKNVAAQLPSHRQLLTEIANRR